MKVDAIFLPVWDEPVCVVSGHVDGSPCELSIRRGKSIPNLYSVETPSREVVSMICHNSKTGRFTLAPTRDRRVSFFEIVDGFRRSVNG